MEDTILAEVIDIIRQTGSIATLDADADFYNAGITSFTMLPLMMSVEEKFSVTLPDKDFIDARTARAVAALVGRLKQGAA